MKDLACSLWIFPVSHLSSCHSFPSHLYQGSKSETVLSAMGICLTVSKLRKRKQNKYETAGFEGYYPSVF